MSDYREFLEASIKEDEKKIAALETVIESCNKIQALAKKNMKVRINVSEIEELEEKCPEFAAATETGFSEEVIKKYVVESFNHLLDPLELEKLQASMLVLFASVALKKPVDFSKFNGEAVYNYVVDKEEFATLRSPMFKKQCIFSDAVKLVVEKKTISFNTAVRRTIEKYENEALIAVADSDDEEMFAEFAAIVNPLIDVYLENELDILAAIGK